MDSRYRNDESLARQSLKTAKCLHYEPPILNEHNSQILSSSSSFVIPEGQQNITLRSLPVNAQKVT